MITLDAKLVAKVLDGAKTQTRLPRREEECRFAPGRSYALKTRGRSATVSRIVVVAVGEELLHEITPEDVRAEGFKTRKQVFDDWRRRYSEGPGEDTPAYPIEIPVWVISFVLDIELRERFPAARSERGYVDQGRIAYQDAEGIWHFGPERDALRGEESAVDAETQERISSGALASDAQRRWDERERERQAERLVRPPEEQLRDELEALRREAPKDAARYEAQVLDLTRRVAAKRKRRAA